MYRPISLAFVLTLALIACGDSGSSTTGATASTTTIPNSSTTTQTSDPTTTTTVTTTGDTVLPRVTVEGGAKTGGLDTISVRIGETVRFEVEADVIDEIHVHGYDISVGTIPGEVVLVEFLADATGIFEVEVEGQGIHILDVEVTP